MECNGYCPSDTFFYNEEEINVASCCSITNLKLKEFKMYCSKKINFLITNQINPYAVSKKDSELIQEFLKNIKNSKWTYVSKKRNNTTGYYTLYMPVNAKCECVRLNN